MTLARKGTVFWISLVVVGFLSLTFSSALFIEVTGDSSLKITEEFLENNLETTAFNLISNSDFIETEPMPYDFELCDYLFWKTETTYYVKNGTTRNIDFFGPDVSMLVETVVSDASDGLLLCFRPGVYDVFSSIDINEKSDVRILGAGKGLTKFCAHSDVSVFNVTGNPQNHNVGFELSGCSVDGGAVLSTQAGISIKHVDNVLLHDLDVTCFDTHVYVQDCQKPSIFNVVVWSNKQFSYGFRFVGFNIDARMHEVSVLHSDPDAVGVRFENYDSIELSKVYVNPTVTRKGSGSGFVFVDCHFVHLIGCVSDGNGNAGFYLSSGFGFYFVDCWSGTNLNGLLSVDADQIQISSCQFYSNTQTGATITAANEVYPSCTIVGSHFLHNKLYGLELENTNHTIVSGNHLKNNTIYGIYYRGGNDYVIISNNDVTDNLDSSFDIYVASPVLKDRVRLENNFGRLFVCE